MQDGETLLTALAGIAVVGALAQWLAWRLRLPSILVLLLAGLLFGSVGLDLLDPDAVFGPLLAPLVSLSVALLLFEGGLSLEVRELRDMGRVLVRMVTIGVGVTWVLTAFAAHWLARLPWSLAILIGALLTVTGPTVIGPLLQHVRPRGRVGPILKWEGIVADLVGATLAVLVFEAILAENLFASTTVALMGLARVLLVAVFAGLAGSLALAIPLRRRLLPDFLHNPFTLAIVLGVYTLCQHVQEESGLLAVSCMGFVLANQKAAPVRHIVEFKENLRVLLISGLFIVLAARMSWQDLQATHVGSVAFVLVLVVVVRPLAVLASTAGSGLSWRERAFLCCIAPRGIVAAAVAALFALRLAALPGGFEGARALAPLAFLVIIGTVAIYGIAAAPLARRLGLSDPGSEGVLLVGASNFARAVAAALSAEGVRVLLVDTNRRHVADARLAGLDAVFGNILSADLQGRLELGGIGKLISLTPNDEVNTLAALHYTELFDRRGVYQLVPTASAKGPVAPWRGRSLFASGAGYEELEERLALGARIKRTRLSEAFDFRAFRTLHGERALPMFRLNADGRLFVFTTDEPPTAAPGDILLSLVDPAEEMAA